jgi:hypothetical protein
VTPRRRVSVVAATFGANVYKLDGATDSEGDLHRLSLELQDGTSGEAFFLAKNSGIGLSEGRTYPPTLRELDGAERQEYVDSLSEI